MVGTVLKTTGHWSKVTNTPATSPTQPAAVRTEIPTRAQYLTLSTARRLPPEWHLERGVFCCCFWWHQPLQPAATVSPLRHVSKRGGRCPDGRRCRCRGGGMPLCLLPSHGSSRPPSPVHWCACSTPAPPPATTPAACPFPWTGPADGTGRAAYGTFRADFHHFDRIELDLRGNTHVRGAAFSCPRLKLADMVLI